MPSSKRFDHGEYADDEWLTDDEYSSDEEAGPKRLYNAAEIAATLAMKCAMKKESLGSDIQGAHNTKLLGKSTWGGAKREKLNLPEEFNFLRRFNIEEISPILTELGVTCIQDFTLVEPEDLAHLNVQVQVRTLAAVNACRAIV